MALEALCSELATVSSPGQTTRGHARWELLGEAGPGSPGLLLGCLFDNPSSRLCGRAVAHTPDNSFMGFVSEELNETEKQLIKDSKASNMAVVYGKEASIWKVSPGRRTVLPSIPAPAQAVLTAKPLAGV